MGRNCPVIISGLIRFLADRNVLLPKVLLRYGVAPDALWQTHISELKRALRCTDFTDKAKEAEERPVLGTGKQNNAVGDLTNVTTPEPEREFELHKNKDTVKNTAIIRL